MEIKKVTVGILQANCYIVSSGDEAVIIDPGDEGERIIKEAQGKKVKYIIPTHHHPDHAGALEEVEKGTGAEVLRQLKEGEEIKVGSDSLRVLHTPGHTEDSICIMGDGFLFSGDTLFYQGYGRTDLPGGDAEKMRETLQRLSEEIPSGTVVYPGHGPSFEK